MSENQEEIIVSLRRKTTATDILGAIFIGISFLLGAFYTLLDPTVDWLDSYGDHLLKGFGGIIFSFALLSFSVGSLVNAYYMLRFGAGFIGVFVSSNVITGYLARIVGFLYLLLGVGISVLAGFFLMVVNEGL